MTKRAFIVHGWGGHPDEAWMPWLDRKLASYGFRVYRLSMPNPDEPVIADWVGTLAAAVGTPDRDTHFIGHSIGVQTVLRYLAGLSEHTRVGKVVCVAGWIQRDSLQDLEPDEIPIAKLWMETPIDFTRVRTVAGPILAIFSDNDPVVVPDNDHRFQQLLGAKTITEHGKGHFSDDSGVTELPAALRFLASDRRSAKAVIP